MIRLTGTFDVSDARDALARLPQAINDALETAVAQTSQALQRSLQDLAPIGKEQTNYRGDVIREPGQLRASIRFLQDGLVSEFVGASYAEYVIGGTSPHAIIAGKAGALSFFWEKAGGFVVFQSVRHPGTRPNDFRMPALAQATEAADDALYEVANVFERI